MKGKRTQADPDADIDVHYWAKATADVAAGAANDEPSKLAFVRINSHKHPDLYPCYSRR